MPTAADFKITIYDKDFNRLGWLGNFESISGTVRWGGFGGGAGSLTFRVPNDDPMVPYIVGVRGARATIQYLGVDLMSGRIKPPSGEIGKIAMLSFTVQDDWAMADDTVAYVNPGNSVAATGLSATVQAQMGQVYLVDTPGVDGTVTGQSGYYQWPAAVSSAEAAIKDLVSKNFPRLNRPVTVQPNLNRGGDARAADILPQVRFGTVAEMLEPLMQWSGLGVRFLQSTDGARVICDVMEPGTWTQTLTPESGIVQDGTWSLGDVAATRGVIGGPGQDAARAFGAFSDTTGLEADFGYAVEVFKDATSAPTTWPEKLDQIYQNAKYFLLRTDVKASDKTLFTRAMTDSAKKALDDGFPKNSISVSLSETKTFHFGGEDGIQLGDWVEINIPVGTGRLPFLDQVLEADFSVDKKGKVQVTPVIGERKDNPDRTVTKALMALHRSSRRISASK